MKDTLKDIKINIHFSEWGFDIKKTNFQKIYLNKFLLAEKKTIDGTDYYVFEGCFLEKNKFRVKPLLPVSFWFTQHTFNREIIRWLDVKKLTESDWKYSIKISVTRLSKNEINFNELILETN